MTIKEKLEEKYFDKLEENLVDFSYEEEIGNGQTVFVVKDKYLHVSVEEMCEYLDMPEWVTEWTVELIDSEENEYIDTQTEFGTVKVTGNKESEIL